MSRWREAGWSDARTLGTDAEAGAMLVACRLAGLSALETYYAGSGDGRFILPSRSQFKDCKMVFTV
jgi:hypothetical protein